MTSLRKLHTEVDLRSLGSSAPGSSSFAYTPGCSGGFAPAGSGARQSFAAAGASSGGCSAPCGGDVTESAVGGGVGFSGAEVGGGGPEEPELACHYTAACCIRPSVIDGYSRVLFPLTFVLFNTIYWVTYLNISEDSISGEDDFVYLKGT